MDCGLAEGCGLGDRWLGMDQRASIVGVSLSVVVACGNAGSTRSLAEGGATVSGSSSGDAAVSSGSSSGSLEASSGSGSSSGAGSDAGDAAAELMGATAVSVGHNSACALLSDGTAQCWGDNTYGELGDSTTTGSATPGTVHGLTGVTAISIGGGADDITACALVSGGAVDCWGGNVDGALGTGTTTGPFNCSTVGTFAGWPCSTTPVAVAGLRGLPPSPSVAAPSARFCPAGLCNAGGTTAPGSWQWHDDELGVTRRSQRADRGDCHRGRQRFGLRVRSPVGRHGAVLREATPTVNLATGPRQARQSPSPSPG